MSSEDLTGGQNLSRQPGILIAHKYINTLVSAGVWQGVMQTLSSFPSGTRRDTECTKEHVRMKAGQETDRQTLAALFFQFSVKLRGQCFNGIKFPPEDVQAS